MCAFFYAQKQREKEYFRVESKSQQIKKIAGQDWKKISWENASRLLRGIRPSQ